MVSITTSSPIITLIKIYIHEFGRNDDQYIALVWNLLQCQWQFQFINCYCAMKRGWFSSMKESRRGWLACVHAFVHVSEAFAILGHLNNILSPSICLLLNHSGPLSAAGLFYIGLCFKREKLLQSYRLGKFRKLCGF